jgi:phage terminase small subunit
VNPKDTAIRASANPDWANGISDKERLFVEGYLQTLNKCHAAEYAGYTHQTASRYAYEIYNRPHVKAAIEKLLDARTGVRKEWLCDKLAAIINTDISDLCEWDDEGNVRFKGCHDLGSIEKFAIQEIVQERGKGNKSIRLRTYDKLAAMAQFAKLFGLLVDRQENQRAGRRAGRGDGCSGARIEGRLNDIAKRQAPTNDGASGSD